MKALLDREDLVFYPPPLGCVLYLPGLPGGSRKIYDRSPYGNQGTIVGATWVKLPSGLWCLSFDGQDDLITIPDYAVFNITTTLTVLQWVKITDISTIAQTLISKYRSADDNREWSLVKSDDDGDIGVYFGDPNDGTFEGRVRTDAEHLVNNIWALVGFTFSSGTVIIYVNGVAVNSSLAAGAIPASLFNGVAPVLVGELLAGSVAISRICNRVLSVLEIRNHFDREKHLFGVW